MSDETKSWLHRAGLLTQTTPAVVEKPRQSGAVVAAEPPRPAEGYQPWGVLHTDSSYLHFRYRTNVEGRRLSDVMPLRLLLNVSCDHGPVSDLMSFSFAHKTLTVAGRGLHELETAILNGKVGFIEEFDAARWGEPAPAACVVLSIEVIEPR